MNNYYELLGIDVNATDNQIKTAFKSRKKEAQKNLFSKNTEVSRKAAKEVSLLTEAYKVLIDPNKRAKYNQNLTVNEELVKESEYVEEIIEESNANQLYEGLIRESNPVEETTDDQSDEELIKESDNVEDIIEEMTENLSVNNQDEEVSNEPIWITKKDENPVDKEAEVLVKHDGISSDEGSANQDPVVSDENEVNDEEISEEHVETNIGIFKKNKVLYGIIAGLSIIALSVFAFIFMSQTPQKIIEKYVTALTVGDFETAYKLTGLTDSRYINAKQFSSIANIKDSSNEYHNLTGTVENLKIEEASNDAGTLSYNVQFDLIKHQVKRLVKIHLTVLKKEDSLLPGYKIDAKPLYGDTTILVPGGSVVEIDGIEATVNERNEIKEKLFLGEHKLVIKHPYFDDYSMDFNKTDSVKEEKIAPKLNLKGDFASKLKGKVDTIIGELFNVAVNSGINTRDNLHYSDDVTINSMLLKVNAYFTKNNVTELAITEGSLNDYYIDDNNIIHVKYSFLGKYIRNASSNLCKGNVQGEFIFKDNDLYLNKLKNYSIQLRK